MEAAMRARLQPKKSKGPTSWAVARYYFGRLLMVAGLMITLVAGTAFFGTPSTIAMLRMMLIGVLFFIPGWLLARKDPGRE
jgi:biotin transporter BioY